MSRPVYGLLFVLACLQIVGVAFGLEKVAGFAAATAASPAPKVFTSIEGLEAFSSRYWLVLSQRDGSTLELALTSERYAALAGPYNRRNPYGAILSLAPVLSRSKHTQRAFYAVAGFALCGRAPLLRELGVNPRDLAATRELKQLPRAGTKTALPLTVEVRCP